MVIWRTAAAAADGEDDWWWMPNDPHHILRVDEGYVLRNDDLSPIAGPFDTLDQAKVAYLMHRSTT